MVHKNFRFTWSENISLMPVYTYIVTFLVATVPFALDTTVFSVNFMHPKQQSQYLQISTYLPLILVIVNTVQQSVYSS
jgi:hypothetical protein